MPSFEPQIRDRGLSPLIGRRAELSGPPERLRFPDLCANCGAATGQRLPVTKVFLRMHRRGRNHYLMATAHVPFCPTCIDQHRISAPELTTGERVLSYFRTLAIIPLVGATTMAVITWEPLQQASTPDEWRLGLAIFSLFVAIALGSVIAGWYHTRRLRVPPQSEITRACDFSDDLGNPITGSRRVYAMRNAAFAEQFIALNSERVWSKADRARARRRELIFAAIVAAVALIAVILGGFGRD